MPGVNLFPSTEEEELIRRFSVNKNYVQALAGFLSSRYGRSEHLYAGLYAELRGHTAFHKVQRVAGSSDEVRRFLVLAWTSEIQLHLPSLIGDAAMIGFANAWAPVHAYYTAFGGLQAWFAANGMAGTANDHTATLKTIATMIQQRLLFPEPWSLLAVGCPLRSEKEHLNVPLGVDCVSPIEVLATPAPSGADTTFWQRYGTWLRSTRSARLRHREEQWKAKQRKPRIPPKVRTQFAESLAPTSLFDCLWRMRIRSNYGNVDPYLVARISVRDHEIFIAALRKVTQATLSLLELYIVRRIGRDEFARIVKEFVSQDGAGLTRHTLQTRLAAYRMAA